MLSTKVSRQTAVALSISLAVSGCATIDNTLGESSGAAACAMGAVAGALVVGGLAAAAGKDAGKGAIAGAALGCGVTYLYQQRVKRLQAIAQEEGLEMQVSELKAASSGADGQRTSVQTVGIEAQVQDSAMFNVGSADLTTDGQRQLRKIAAALAEGQKGANSDKKILVVGHTDATGSAEFNQRLSERRARAVGGILAEAGIASSNIYYQGAGASRPIADNTTEQGRAKNRRVELAEVDSQQLLIERVRAEHNNPKYLAHGATSKPAAVTRPASATKPEAQPRIEATRTEQPATPAPSTFTLAGKGPIDFGGRPVTTAHSTLAQSIKPKSSSFSLIPTAYAAAPVHSCLGDMPRLTGEVKNLATDQALSKISTTDYLPGLNGRPWGKDVNGHVALVGPISVLKEDAAVVQQPFMQFITNYRTASKKQSAKFQGVANTYEGENQVLYRVFAVDQANSPISCMDIVFDKRAGHATAGEIYYPQKGAAYVADFQPIRK